MQVKDDDDNLCKDQRPKNVKCDKQCSVQVKDYDDLCKVKGQSSSNVGNHVLLLPTLASRITKQVKDGDNLYKGQISTEVKVKMMTFIDVKGQHNDRLRTPNMFTLDQQLKLYLVPSSCDLWLIAQRSIYRHLCTNGLWTVEH